MGRRIYIIKGETGKNLDLPGFYEDSMERVDGGSAPTLGGGIGNETFS
jgi:hypothetical protein